MSHLEERVRERLGIPQPAKKPKGSKRWARIDRELDEIEASINALLEKAEAIKNQR